MKFVKLTYYRLRQYVFKVFGLLLRTLPLSLVPDTRARKRKSSFKSNDRIATALEVFCIVKAKCTLCLHTLTFRISFFLMVDWVIDWLWNIWNMLMKWLLLVFTFPLIFLFVIYFAWFKIWRLSSEVVSALISHKEGRWFESHRRCPSYLAVEIDAYFLIGADEKHVVRRDSDHIELQCAD